MTVVRRGVDLWVHGVGAVLAVVLVALLPTVVGTPGWWVSLIVTSTVVAVAVIVAGRILQGSVVVAVAVCIGVVGAAGGLVGATLHARDDARSVADTRAQAARVGAQTVCRVVQRGTPARAAEALSASTGDLADRLRSGAAVLGAGSAGEATCRPVSTGVSSASVDEAVVVALVDVTSAGTTVGQAVEADLRRVDGRWAVASLRVLR